MSVSPKFVLFDQHGRDKIAELLSSIKFYLAISLASIVNFTKCLWTGKTSPKA